MTRKLSLLILRAWKVSSGTAITAAIEVSLNSEMKLLPTLGSAFRSAIGRITQIAVPVRVRPIDAAASVMPLGMTRIAARNDSVEIGAGIDGEHRGEGVVLEKRMPYCGRAKKAKSASTRIGTLRIRPT